MTEDRPPRVRVTVAPATIAVVAGIVAGIATVAAPLLIQSALLVAWVVGIVTYVVVAAARLRR